MQYPYYYPQLNIKGRPVASLEEVKAMSIDFDGSVFYFPDLAHNMIYTKQVNMDGTATINIYERKELPMPEQPVTRSEFEELKLLVQNLTKPAEVPRPVEEAKLDNARSIPREPQARF